VAGIKFSALHYFFFATLCVYFINRREPRSFTQRTREEYYEELGIALIFKSTVIYIPFTFKLAALKFSALHCFFFAALCVYFINRREPRSFTQRTREEYYEELGIALIFKSTVVDIPSTFRVAGIKFSALHCCFFAKTLWVLRGEYLSVSRMNLISVANFIASIYGIFKKAASIS